MKYYTLGTSHGATEKNRSCSCNLVEVNGAYYLFDCGGDAESKMQNADLDIDLLRCVFISHMHSDHVNSLGSVAKRFAFHYNKIGSAVRIFMPEENGLEAYKTWISAVGVETDSDKLIFGVEKPGVVYSDENVTVTAIATAHLQNGAKPSFAFMIETADGKRVLYTGDLNCDFHDYPKIVFEKDFDLIVSELVHFNVEKNLDTITASRTKKLVFTHMAPRNIPIINDVKDRFPYEVFIAEDGNCYEV